MNRLVEHLQSPQYTDADGNATGQARVPFFVAPGRPRWLGYLFCLIGFVIGAVLALGVIGAGDEMGQELIQIIGIVAMLSSLYGAWEVWRGKAPSLRGAIDRLRNR